MKRGNLVILTALVAFLLSPVFTGCGKDVLPENERVSVSFSLPVGQAAGGVATKMSGDVVQNDNPKTFRGIQQLYVLPFKIEAENNVIREIVYASDAPEELRAMPYYTSLMDFKDNQDKTIKGYIFDGVVMNRGVNTVLVYGLAAEKASETMAPGSVPYKQHFGSLVLTAPSKVAKAGDIQFNLEPFLSIQNQKDAFSQWKSDNIALLNEVANASVTIGDKTYSFKTPSSYNSATLESVLNAFTSEGVVFPGSNAMIGQKMTALYKSCKNLSQNATGAVKELAGQICTIIEGRTDLLEIADSGTVTRKVAEDEVFGLPDGVVTVRWGVKLSDGSLGFDSPDKPEGVNVTAVADFCYPPSLWYYVNSPLLSSSDDTAKDLFENNGKWSEIISKGNGWVRGVTNVTRMAAVRDALQYGVALLCLNIKKAAATSLKDNKDKDVSIDNDSFPLTGVIIGGQRTQTFDFTVLDDPDNDMRFIYDADVNDKDGNAQAWISSTTDNSPVFTLALPTRQAEDINFALEFRNDSGVSFVGARECTILPGSKFYLIGTMKYDEGTTSGSEKPAGVFVKDCYTTLNVSFEALASSYSILPDLNAADLQFGVNAKLTWDALTTSYISIK